MQMKKALLPYEAALREQAMQDFADVPTEDEIEHTFSGEFESAMQKLIKTGKKPVLRAGSMAKRLLIAAIIISLLAGCTMAAPGIIKFFTHNTGERYYFTVDEKARENAPLEIETVYSISDVPEGFEIYDEAICEGFASYAYRNEKTDKWISFDQEIVTGYPENHLGGEPDSEYSTMSKVTIDGYEVVRIIHEEGAIQFTWTNEEYFFDLYCDNCFTINEAYEIFRSIRPDADRTEKLKNG